MAAVKPPPEQVALAHRVWLILDAGFGGLPEPPPSWRRPTKRAVLAVLERRQPGAIIAEHAAREARITLQRREDGRNVVGLFEFKLERELQKQAGVHRRVLDSMDAAAPVAGGGRA